MTDKEFNEKCAEYLGWTFDKYRKANKNSYYKDYKIWLDKNNKAHSKLKFNSDWNWIMLLLEAILDECGEEDKLRSYYVVVDNIPDLEMTKQAIIDYWNNE
jgi:hypothetical protein